MGIYSLWHIHIGTTLTLCRTMCCRTRHQRRHLCAMKTNVVLPPWPVQQLPKATGFASEITWKGGSLELSDSLGAVLTVSCRWRCCTKNFLRRGGGRRRSIQLWLLRLNSESRFKFLWLAITQQFPSWAPCLPIILTPTTSQEGKLCLPYLLACFPFLYGSRWLMAAPVHNWEGEGTCVMEQQID